MTPTRRAQPLGTFVPRATFLLAILAGVAACAPSAGGPGGSGAILTNDKTAKPMDRLHQQAHDALQRWADAVRKSGGATITFVGDLTGQIGTWEVAVGEDSKSALMAGRVETSATLSDAPARAQVKWLDGSSVDVTVLSAADTLAALVASGDGGCPECRPLAVTDAQLGTGLVDTSRGPANAPTWVFSIAGTSVKVTRVAVDKSVTVDPPPWNANDPPEGISIDAATGAEGSKKLTVTFVGAVKDADQACGADYTAEAVESPLAIVVIVHEERNPTEVACDAVGKTRAATLTLDAALGTRAVLEVKQGLPVSVTSP
jgi:hypothetical protein